MSNCRTFSSRTILALLAAVITILGAVHTNAQSYVSQAQSNGFTLKKVVSDTSLASGQSFSYTIYYSFPAGASSVTITDILPPALNYQGISITSPCGAPVVTAPAVGTNGTVSLTWASAPTGCSGSFVITVEFPNGTTCDNSSARNRVCLSGTLAGQKTEFCTGYVLTTAHASNPWNIGKWVTSAAWQGGTCPYATGDSVVTYQICVYKNVGTTGQLNLVSGVVKDTLPTGAYLQSSSCGATQTGNVITWNVGNLSALPAYNSACCTFTVVYPPSIFPNGSQVKNQAYLTGTLGSANQSCGNASHASAQTCVEIKSFTSATLAKYVYTNRQPGCTGQYLIYICNNGTTPIAAFTVKDTLPTTLTGYTVGTTSPGITATITAGVLTVTSTGALPVGQCRYVYINFNIPATATVGSTITNCAYMTIPAVPSALYQACAAFTVDAPAPAPCVWKEVCNKQTSYTPGSTFRYRLRIQNIGGQPITGATITDNLNANLQYVGNASFYTTSSWSAPCQTTSNWTGVTITPSGNNLAITLPTIPASCQNIFYGNCGMYGTSGVPFYFVEFDVKVTDTSALGNIPNVFALSGGNLTGTTTSNIEYVNVIGTIGFSLTKSVAADTSTWTNTLTTTAGGNANYRLRLTVSPGSVGLRHITFTDLLPMDNGASDQLILPPCSSRGSLFNVNFNSTVSTAPLASGYANGASFSKVDNFAPAGAPGPMFTGTCGTLGTWSASIPASSKNLGYYFGATPIGATGTATAVVKVNVANTATSNQEACNTFAANGAVRHLINSTIISDQVAGQLESQKVCMVIGTVKPCIERLEIGVKCAGKDGAGNQQYTIQINGVNGGAPGTLALNSTEGSFAPSTFSIPSGPFSVTTTFTDLPPAASIITIHYGILGPNGQVICRDSIRRDLPPCPSLPPESCCEKFIHKFPKVKVSADGFGNVSLVTTMVAGPSPIKRFTATIVSAQRRRVCGNTVGAWERIFGDVIGGALVTAPAPGPQLLSIFSRQAEWGPGECVNWNQGATLGLKMLFPQPYCAPCRDTLTFGIRYTFTDCECKTCDTVIFYTVGRKCTILPWDPTHGTSIENTKVNDKPQADVPTETSFIMSNETAGSLYIVNPVTPEDEGVTVTAVEVSSPDAAITSIGYNGQNGLVLSGSGFTTTNIPPGTTGKVDVTFDNPAVEFPVYVKYTYTIPGFDEPLTSESIKYLARVPQTNGTHHEMGEDSTANPTRVRTYAMYFKHASSYQAAIHSLALKARSGASILAFGMHRNGDKPTVTQQSLSSSMVEVDLTQDVSGPITPGQTIKPIYITISGDVPVPTFDFMAIDEFGIVVDSGMVALSDEITSVGIIAGNPPKIGVAIRPNPAAHTATITLNTEDVVQGASLKIYNNTGSLVATLFTNEMLQPGATIINASLSDLASGSYLVVLQNVDGTITLPLNVIK